MTFGMIPTLDGLARRYCRQEYRDLLQAIAKFRHKTNEEEPKKDVRDARTFLLSTQLFETPVGQEAPSSCTPIRGDQQHNGMSLLLCKLRNSPHLLGQNSCHHPRSVIRSVILQFDTRN
jgi:hypothetical protein